MASDFERNLEKYAEVIVKVGLNIQPGQRLLIGPPFYGYLGTELETAPLVRLIAAKAYQAGAKLVDVMWRDDRLKLIRLQHAPRESLEEFPAWRAERAIEAARAGDAILYIVSPDFDLFSGQNPELINKIFKTNMKHMKPFLDLRGKRSMSFVLVAAPIQGWADKVFPDLPPEDRIRKFWDTVFEVCRVYEPDPISTWKKHIDRLVARCAYLNNKHYAGLQFTASGTDLRLGLPKGHIWKSANWTTQSGIDFITNIPTEEIFTLPHKDKVDGVVTSTRIAGTRQGMIEDLVLTFAKGEVVKVTAKQGQEIVQRSLEVDDGARRLGEVALVPHRTPISQTGRLFYIPLYDENASCHLARGNAYRHSIEGGEKMSEEEFMAVGGNNSQIHIDFMIGSDEMDVDGITDNGSTEPIMRGGEWAFEP